MFTGTVVIVNETSPSHQDPAVADSSNVVQATPGGEPALRPDDELDLDAIEIDLDDVESALSRLDDGSYWTDEVSGEPIPDEVLHANPTSRRGR